MTLALKTASILSFVLVSTSWGVADDPESSCRDLRRTPVVKAYQRVRGSVVNLAATQRIEVRRSGVDLFGNLFTFPQAGNAQTVGSGFVIHEDGYIGTNAHVVSAGAELTATLPDGSVYPARVISRDTSSDLAIIKIDPKTRLVPITLGRSDDLMIGEQTIAVGNPVGLHNTVTTGVVSALHRDLVIGGRTMYGDLIQTDASINPGNSGGPLLNVYGDLIGINTAIRTDVQNIGFAIPVDRLRKLVPKLLDSEKLRHLEVGMKISDSIPLHVISVREDGPARRAGVRLGDYLEELDGKPLRCGIDFYVALLESQPQDALMLTLRREGESKKAKLVLQPMAKPDGRRLALARLGLRISDVQDAAARRFGWDRTQHGSGVIVLAVEPKSPAQRADLQPGDLLVSMGPYWLNGVDHVGALLSGVESQAAIDVGFRRERGGRFSDGERRLSAR